jgi:hypothetical protein
VIGPGELVASVGVAAPVGAGVPADSVVVGVDVVVGADVAVLGAAEPLADGPGVAVVLDDVGGLGSTGDSPSALVADAPTSVTVASRVPARRSSAGRVGAVVDIRASLSGS